MRYLLIVIGLSLLSIEGKSQEIDNITGQTIDQKRITMPADVKGKYTLLCFASSTKAQKDLETWLDPVYQKFGLPKKYFSPVSSKDFAHIPNSEPVGRKEKND